LTSVSGLIAGAMSMAAGEFVSVRSQEDTENADLARERAELKRDPGGERGELAGIYVGRGLERPLADKVAGQLMANDAIGARARRTGLVARDSRPSDAGGAGLGGQLLAWRSTSNMRCARGNTAHLILWVSIDSLVFPAGLGAVSARLSRRRRILGDSLRHHRNQQLVGRTQGIDRAGVDHGRTLGKSNRLGRLDA